MSEVKKSKKKFVLHLKYDWIEVLKNFRTELHTTKTVYKYLNKNTKDVPRIPTAPIGGYGFGISFYFNKNIHEAVNHLLIHTMPSDETRYILSGKRHGGINGPRQLTKLKLSHITDQPPVGDFTKLAEFAHSINWKYKLTKKVFPKGRTCWIIMEEK